ncbi:hypothetical protein ACLB2K_037016 [Fragaria x ananassa]
MCASLSNLRQLPDNLGSLVCLKVLDISGSGIRQVPSSIQLLKNLTELSCAGCQDLPAENSSWCLPTLNSCFLPSDSAANNSSGLQLSAPFSGLCSLRELILSDCNLSEGAIPDEIGYISWLKYLDLSGNNFETSPQTISQLYQLEDLLLNDCSNLKSLLTLLPITIRDCDGGGTCQQVLYAPADDFSKSFTFSLLPLPTHPSSLSSPAEFSLIRPPNRTPPVPFDSHSCPLHFWSSPARLRVAWKPPRSDGAAAKFGVARGAHSPSPVAARPAELWP